ncbi:hypothetical protein EJ08DRAFT_600422, partial [Tothia fuscella]
LEIQATNNDISRYLQRRIELSSRLRNCIKSDDNLKQLIVSTLVERSQGMVVLAKLHIDALITKTSVKAIHNALETMPKKLDATYYLIMARIDEQNDDDAKLARRLLSWLTYSARPMTVAELQHALVVDLQTYSVDKDSLIDQEMMLSVCGGIVTVEESSSIIRLIHYTTQEYLERIRETRFPLARLDITLACLAYLRGRGFPTGVCTTHEEWAKRNAMFPFLNYAGRYWTAHVSGEVEDATQKDILDFLTNNSASAIAAQVFDLVEFGTGARTYDPENRMSVRIQKGFHLVAYFGLPNTLTVLITMA